MFNPKLPRMSWTLMLALALCAVLALFAAQQLPVILYKVALVVIAGVAGYWLDRAIFPYARPHVALPVPDHQRLERRSSPLMIDRSLVLYVTAQARRTIIVAASILAVGLGL